MLCIAPSPADKPRCSAATDFASSAANDVENAAEDAPVDGAEGPDRILAIEDSAAAAMLVAMASPAKFQALAAASIYAPGRPSDADGSLDGCLEVAEAVLGTPAAAADSAAPALAATSEAAASLGSASPPERASVAAPPAAEKLPVVLPSAGGLTQDLGTVAVLAPAEFLGAEGELEAAAALQSRAALSELVEELGAESEPDDGYATAEDAGSPEVMPSASAEHGARRSPSLEPSLACTALGFEEEEEGSALGDEETSPERAAAEAGACAATPATTAWALTRVRAL
jgi:hypothetical protein